VSEPTDLPEDERPPSASAGERIHMARYVLIVAVAALLATSLFWDVPLAFSAGACLLVLAVADLVPRRRGARRILSARSVGAGTWPDTSMKATVEAFPQASFILDAAGIVRYGNSKARQLFPATRPGDRFTLTFRSPELGAALGAARGGEPSSTEYHEPGDTTTYYAVTFGPVRAAAGAVAFVLVVFDDVSDRQALARMRADFVANASHELRTPLASLTGFIETLLGPARNDPQASERFLHIMLDQARRMRRLIDDLLSLSRAEMRVHRRPTDIVDLVAVLRHVSDALSPLAAEQSVVLSLDAPAEPVAVVGDRDELVQVFQNLVENAIRYGASGGKVEVTVEPRPGSPAGVAVHVQDYGPGIAPEHLPRLTERFYRIDVGASREMKGTGLGLAIVKHILVRHQGRLEVKSRQGEGARFTVELPLAEAERSENQKMPKT
jgi:two-component system phosphate regulon sensor histidine kinase PhoR